MRDPGAPVDLYRLLNAADEPELIDREMPEDAEILELGAGSGRITQPLTALGWRVVAVDFNPEMLELIEGAETVQARITGATSMSRPQRYWSPILTASASLG